MVVRWGGPGIGESRNPGAKLRIAGVGPLVSLLLGEVFLGVAALLRAIIDWFVVGAATAENQQVTGCGRLGELAIRDVMAPNPETAPGSMTVEELRPSARPSILS